ncbi:MAG: 50S ribosomal protein L3 [Candidatus Pacebacteria bacterium]|nr:50S ribosomal protein L3 [Candidatus Paceibacterota bacterium]
MKFILGKKLGMSQIFDKEGKVTPVTLVEAGPCKILQVKTRDKDGYEALQVGFVEKKKKIKKTDKGKEFRYIKEQRLDGSEQYKVGDEINVAIFNEGDKVKIIGTSKGKGFQGAVKRWGFKGKLSKTHGTKHEIRTLGSTGSSIPARVIKGRKMPGRMGQDRVTINNLKIVKVDKENNLLALKGALPGPKGALIEIKG